MKNIYTHLLALTFVICFGYNTTAQAGKDQPLTYQFFVDQLAQSGVWMESNYYGMVWHPYAGPDFRPYVTNGRWVATNEGWAWASDYKWGWAAFHYGRWYYDSLHGWLWQPGSEWAPAWVTWGYAGDYYCWAALMPEVATTTTYVAWNPPPFYWNGCLKRNITHPNLKHVTIKPDSFSAIRSRIRKLENFAVTRRENLHYATGPSLDEADKHIVEKIRIVSITDMNRIGRARLTSKNLEVYRPDIRNSTTPVIPATDQARDTIPSTSLEEQQIKTSQTNMPAKQQGETQNGDLTPATTPNARSTGNSGDTKSP